MDAPRVAKETKAFKFQVPPEAPVFHPTEEEFVDALAYINSIRPIAEASGICKIRPPPGWQPPFALDIDNFRFTPRIQKLNELEAKTRVKLNFLGQVARFWELQGTPLRIPEVEKRALDLYTLDQLVKKEGGPEAVLKERKWAKIADLMGYSSEKEIGRVLKTHFEKLLYSYDLFMDGRNDDSEDEFEDVKDEKADEDFKPPEKFMKTSSVIDFCYEDRCKNGPTKSRELKRLKFFGPGPKMAGFNCKTYKRKLQAAVVNYNPDPLAQCTARNCSSPVVEASTLNCSNCNHRYHMVCLVPPLTELPKADWSCPECVAKEVAKPTEAFGFEQAEREYNLHQFGEMADKFKKEYFKTEPHLVPTGAVEKEFWRIVSSIDEDVTVEYGADLHTVDHGSGFPTVASKTVNETDKEYVHSLWNLNNLPVAEGSVLRHIPADVSGMKIPWMYVGMCFATFCWHNEDHWNYSINYLHWGESKTWYGVPSSRAADFEEAMKAAAPELFEAQPDLLHQLVTIMNPNILMKAGIPIYRTDQNAGEFVITFPRAYHAGFNQGFNFAEAVNFAPSDWLKMGRECMLHYSHLRRYCVFSHDELVCQMALHVDKLSPSVAAATYEDMKVMISNESKLLEQLLDWGGVIERRNFEKMPDDERQCEVCKTTCFLSAIICSCTKDRLVCLRHYADLCLCPPRKHTLFFHYALDELEYMLGKLKKMAAI